MNNSLIEKYDMLPPGSSVLCAVSGGADSMCMLHLLHELENSLSITVAAAHFEHGIRGEESLRDSCFVREYCKTNSIPFFFGSADVPSVSVEMGMSVEETARKLRYEFLEKTAEENGFTKIATAHNADDNAETVIFNLARGSGLKGLCGIPPVRGKIIRPILDMTRSEIEAYLSEYSVPHVEDSTNAADEYSRNRIRHHVIPVLREINPAFSETALRNCELLRSDEDYLNREAESIAQRFSPKSVPCEEINQLPFPIASRTLRIVSGSKLSLVHTEELLQFSQGTGYGVLNLPGLMVKREMGVLSFLREKQYDTELCIPERILEIGKPLLVPEAGLIIEAAVAEAPASAAHGNDTIIRLNNNGVVGKLSCSSRRSGDAIRPAGRGCTKKLKTLFLEAGFTQKERNLTPVFRDEEGIIAVPGIAIAERCRFKPGEMVLEIRIRHNH